MLLRVGRLSFGSPRGELGCCRLDMTTVQDTLGVRLSEILYKVMELSIAYQ